MQPMMGERHQQQPQAWQTQWQSQANRLNFALRNFLNWSPAIFREQPAGALDFSDFPQADAERARDLLSRYGLTDLPQRACRQRVMETLTYLDWLDQLATTHPEWFEAFSAENFPANNTQPDSKESAPPTLHWLDVGAKNWAYVEALAAFAKAHQGENFRLDGVELDPHRRYANFQTRRQAAQTFIADIPQASYHAGDILQWNQPAHIITHFLPFVLEDPHLAWGLPLDYFQPQRILNHVLNLLQPGGLLIVVNQGEWEAEAQEKLFQKAQESHALEVKPLGELPARFIDYQYPRFGWLCRKC
jgi:hypothetical protein